LDDPRAALPARHRHLPRLHRGDHDGLEAPQIGRQPGAAKLQRDEGFLVPSIEQQEPTQHSMRQGGHSGSSTRAFCHASIASVWQPAQA
jgi:hypothetical protein